VPKRNLILINVDTDKQPIYIDAEVATIDSEHGVVIAKGIYGDSIIVKLDSGEFAMYIADELMVI
jgi:hypothetical protein